MDTNLTIGNYLTGTLENENNPSINLFIDENATLIAYFSPIQLDITFDISHTDGGDNKY